MSKSSPHLLAARSDLLSRLRHFFLQRGFLEVETPLLADEVIPEEHIEPFTVERHSSSSRDATHRSPASRSDTATATFFLQASPELHMKRLLADDAEAIFQVTRSFRAGERGSLHRPEFTIVEWYRAGDEMRSGMSLLGDLCQQLLGTPPIETVSYGGAFTQHVGLCPHTSPVEHLASRAVALDVNVPESLDPSDRDQWLHLLMATCVEPQLGRSTPTILFDYPASQAALAKLRPSENGSPVAERFELYYQGLELANGYHELTDATELRQRFEKVNRNRLADGRRPLPLPELLLAAMQRGLPDCTGVALGFDRLLMLATGAPSIDEVLAF